MRKYLFLLLVCTVATGICRSQRYYNQQADFLNANKFWAMSTNAGVDFSGGNTRTVKTAMAGASGSAAEGGTAVADPVTGQLLFYSNGWRCWDRNHQVMPNGDSLLGNGVVASTCQGACIVPFVGQPGSYYLFSLNYQGHQPSLYYSVIDMSLNGGMGDIVANRKNIVLDTTALSESMIAVPGNNCDIWLLLHSLDNPVFKAYHITRGGLETRPVISTAGTQISGKGAYIQGFMTISPNREILAVSSGGLNATSGTLLCTFDPGNGIVSGGILLSRAAMACSFSPDNTRLYGNGLFQYDISNYKGSTIPPPVFVANGAGAPRLYNDTVYCWQNNGLGRITRPNLIAPYCNYEARFLSWQPGAVARNGLGTEVVYPLPPDTIGEVMLDTAICSYNASFRLSLGGRPGYKGYLWQDGDTAALRTITQRGVYWVLSKDACHSRSDTFIITGTEGVDPDLGKDTIICNNLPYRLDIKTPFAEATWSDGSSGQTLMVWESGAYYVTIRDKGCVFSDTINIAFKDVTPDLGPDTSFCLEQPFSLTLNAQTGNSRAQYLWNTGSSGPEMLVQAAGQYWVTVTDPPCAGQDTITVTGQYCQCVVHMPTAFSPNRDGLNDIFRPVIAPECPVGYYSLQVFNRWGQRVFSSAAYGQGWDGTIGDAQADLGTYTYYLSLEAGTQRKRSDFKGDLILIR